MPLKKGTSSKVVARNVKEMIQAGHDPRQAVAAAERTKDESRRKKRGRK
jgi:type IV secretory pathway VirB6-like protein